MCDLALHSVSKLSQTDCPHALCFGSFDRAASEHGTPLGNKTGRCAPTMIFNLCVQTKAIPKLTPEMCIEAEPLTATQHLIYERASFGCTQAQAHAKPAAPAHTFLSGLFWTACTKYTLLKGTVICL